ncbi:MAG: DUF3644 domain-containing protein, partial [Candidatus Eremiobacteraeota bacterium]|nr:DUF3644 domain-containing protein [Candidatus Eremiobacteraeota bacterium]
MAPKNFRYYLAVAKQEALLACDLYNEPRQPRSFELFVVHMEAAWLNLFHAVQADLGGEEESWDLAGVVQAHLPSPQDPVRRNIEFFIGLRGRIEHRLTARQLRSLETVVSGKAQAYLRDFDTYLVREFGEKQSLGDSLRFPVFLLSLARNALDAMKESYRRVPAATRKFIEAFDAATDDATRSDPAYDFKVYLIPKSAGGPEADLAMEFVRLEDLAPEQREQVQAGTVLIRDRHVEVANVDRLKPSDVVARVRPVWEKFSLYYHTLAYRYFKVR